MQVPAQRRIAAFMCYPYLHILDLIRKGKGPRFVSTVPTLYCYGATKNYMFHTRWFLKKLEDTEGCAWKEYSDADHWIHETHAAELAKDVKAFLESNDGK